MKATKKHRETCEKCGSQNLKASRTMYPVHIGGKQLNIERVSVKECIDCHSIKPTKAGQEKIERCSMTFMFLLDGG